MLFLEYKKSLLKLSKEDGGEVYTKLIFLLDMEGLSGKEEVIEITEFDDREDIRLLPGILEDCFDCKKGVLNYSFGDENLRYYSTNNNVMIGIDGASDTYTYWIFIDKVSGC